MADLKISALPASTVPLAGTEVLPIVQSSATKQVTVANLTAGRAVATGALTVTGDATLSTGNLVIGTSGKGIDFSANTPKAGMTSQLLNWYEEGTFTATATPLTLGSITLGANTLSYTKVGRVVTITGSLGVSSVSSPEGRIRIGGLPFACKSGTAFDAACILPTQGLSTGATLISQIPTTQSFIDIYRMNGANWDDTAANITINGTTFWFSISYIA